MSEMATLGRSNSIRIEAANSARGPVQHHAMAYLIATTPSSSFLSRGSCSISRGRRTPRRTPGLLLAAASSSSPLSYPPPRYQHELDSDASPNAILLDTLRVLFCDLQYFVMFLLEQPKELKYLEFPSLRSAARMAVLTIAVVMVLIVLLATIDSGLSYVAATFFRRLG